MIVPISLSLDIPIARFAYGRYLNGENRSIETPNMLKQNAKKVAKLVRNSLKRGNVSVVEGHYKMTKIGIAQLVEHSEKLA